MFPFILLFGVYVILNGHLTPGGGFQGGAILASAVLIIYFIDSGRIANLNLLIKIEKYTFILLILLGLMGLFTKGSIFTNLIPLRDPILRKKLLLVLLNLLIGVKVAAGLITIFSTFIEEGRE